MKKFLTFLIAIVALFSMQSCTNPGVDAGEELVKIQKPWLFGSGGVVMEPLTEGRQILALSTDYVVYNMKPVKYEENFDNIITHDNNPIDFTAYITLQIKAGESPKLHKTFGEKWYFNNVEETFRSMIRGYCSMQPMFTLTTDRHVVDSLETVIHNEMTTYIDGLEMPVKVIGIVIGKVTPPDAVLYETTKTAAEKQAIKTQEAREFKEEARGKADIAKATADMAYKNTFTGMTIPQYLYLRSLEIEAEKIDMVKGKKNVTINMVQGGGATPVIPLK